jgi:hypothetical protein
MRPEKTLVQIVTEQVAVVSVPVLLALICGLWFAGARVYGCFRYRVRDPVRELGFLFAGPLVAMLVVLMKGSSAAAAMAGGGIDAGFGLVYGLDAPIRLCALAVCGFGLGLLALMLPQKTKPDSQHKA